MKVDGALKSLIQGVSQQPPRVRYPGQCTLQENMSSNAVDGLQRRPPVVLLSDMFTSAEEPQWYDYEVKGTRYVIAFTTGGIRAFDLEGNEYTVNEASDGFDYLDGSKLVMNTLENTTYVANTAVEVAMDTTLSDYVEGTSILFILGANYGRTYKVILKYVKSGVDTELEVSFTAPDGSTSAHTAQITTTNIMSELYDALVAHTDFTPDGFTATLKEDHLYITGSTYEFTVQTSDGDGDSNLYAVNNRARSVTRVPKYAPQNYVLTIQSGTNADSANLYLKFQTHDDTIASGSGFGEDGAWYETVAPGIEYLLDTSTMPHVLTFDDVSEEFTFGPGGWYGRRVGDTDSNENPSFVGRTINHISYFQGRLVFLSGLATVMSRTNDPLDFYLKTATALLDDDPIDIESTAKDVAKLERAIPFNRDLVIFSNNAQFIVFGRNALTPKNSSLVLTSTFEAELRTTPVAAGRNIFFGINYGRYTGVREFYADGTQDINDARPITSHVIKYMPGQVHHMASTSNFNLLVVQTTDSNNELYVYEYLWQEQRRLQSSWSKWILPDDVSYFFLIESVLYLVTKIGNNYKLVHIDMDTTADDGLEYQVLLDNKLIIDNVNTTIADPWTDMPDTDDVYVVQGAGCPNPGMRAAVTYDSDNNQFVLEQDMEGGSVLIGVKYLSRYEPTMPMVKDKDGTKIGTGRLVVQQFLVNYRDSGVINAIIKSKYEEYKHVYWSGRVVGDPSTVVGKTAISTSTFVCPFSENVEYATLELWSDHFTPMNIMDIEWGGTYTKRGTRIIQGEG